MSAAGAGGKSRETCGGRWQQGRDGPESPGSATESNELGSGHRWMSAKDLDGRLDKMKSDLEVQFRKELQGQMMHVLEQLHVIAANVGSKAGENYGKAIEFSSRKVPATGSMQRQMACMCRTAHDMATQGACCGLLNC